MLTGKAGQAKYAGCAVFGEHKPTTEHDAVVTYRRQWCAHTTGYAGSIPAVPNAGAEIVLVDVPQWQVWEGYLPTLPFSVYNKRKRKGDKIMRFASTGTRYVSGVSFTRGGRVRGAGGGNGGSGG